LPEISDHEDIIEEEQFDADLICKSLIKKARGKSAKQEIQKELKEVDNGLIEE